MQMTGEDLLVRYRLLSAIINDHRRPIATTGAYRLAKLFRAMEPDGTRLEKERNALIKDLGDKMEGQEAWTVPKERSAEFEERWTPIAKQMLTVELKPIPLRLLGDGGGISAAEFIVLDGLIVEW